MILEGKDHKIKFWKTTLWIACGQLLVSMPVISYTQHGTQTRFPCVLGSVRRQALEDSRKTQTGSPRANESLSSLSFQEAVRELSADGDKVVRERSLQFGTNMAAVMGHSQSGTWTVCNWSSKSSVQAVVYPLPCPYPEKAPFQWPLWLY